MCTCIVHSCVVDVKLRQMKTNGQVNGQKEGINVLLSLPFHFDPNLSSDVLKSGALTGTVAVLHFLSKWVSE